MKKREFIRTIVYIQILLFTLVPCICFASGMGDINLDIEVAATSLHEWMPTPEYNPIDNEFVVLWHITGVREEGGENLYSLHGQRISPNGGLLGEPFSPISSIGPERRILPIPAHNPFTNQYTVAFVMGQKLTDWDPFITRIASDGTILSEPAPLSENPARAAHPTIVFNSTRRQFLVAYNDSRNGNADIFGVIVDEYGNIVREDFSIFTAQGEQINPFCCYNPSDDTYLINWEDFRNVSTWTEPSDIYGTLLDGAGNTMVADIPMCEDHGMDNEGDQRHNNIAYNPDKNEFLVCWTDTRPSLNNVGIVGRIIKSDGSLGGPYVTLSDAPGAQIFPHVLYAKKRRMYFAIWEDNRNGDPDTFWREAANLDIYAKWLGPSGKSVGTDFPICTEEGTQRFSKLTYNPVMDRFLIVWQDVVEEEVLEEEGSAHVMEVGGNIMGKIYGRPSFLTGRILEQETGNPVGDALVISVGLALPAIETTNCGGWFNMAKGLQISGTYFIFVFKAGYQTVVESVSYGGEPLDITIEIKKR